MQSTLFDSSAILVVIYVNYARDLCNYNAVSNVYKYHSSAAQNFLIPKSDFLPAALLTGAGLDHMAAPSKRSCYVLRRR